MARVRSSIRVQRHAAIACGALWMLSVSACGGSETPRSAKEKHKLEVDAIPPGFTFETKATVELIASRSARIRFTLDGADPAAPYAREYDHPIVLEESTLISFIAVGTDGVWSAPEHETYMLAPPQPAIPAQLPRALQVDQTSLWFALRPGQGETEATLQLRSTGLETVHVWSVGIGPGSHGGALGGYEQDVFKLKSARTFDLPQGHEVQIVVSYSPTNTLRSALLLIDSDEMAHPGGPIAIQLWGRVFSNW